MAEYGTEIGKFSFEGNNLMPEVIIKARIRQEKHESTERFYGIRYIGKEALEQRNYQNFEHMLSYFHNFLIPMRKSDPDAEKQNNRQHTFESRRNKRRILYAKRRILRASRG